MPPGRVQGCLGRLQASLGRQEGLVGLVHFHLGGSADLQQGQSVVIVVLGQAQLLLQQGQVRAAVVGHRAVIALLGTVGRGLGILQAQAGALVIKAAQQVPGRDGVPYGNGHLLHIAGDHGYHAGSTLCGDGADVCALGAQVPGLDGGGLHRYGGVQQGLLHRRPGSQPRRGSGHRTIKRKVCNPWSRVPSFLPFKLRGSRPGPP